MPARGTTWLLLTRCWLRKGLLKCPSNPQQQNLSPHYHHPPTTLQVDLVSKEPGDAPPTVDFAALLRAMPENCSYADMEAAVAAA